MKDLCQTAASQLLNAATLSHHSLDVPKNVLLILLDSASSGLLSLWRVLFSNLLQMVPAEVVSQDEVKVMEVMAELEY